MVRYGIIGSGAIARVTHLPQLRRDPRVELVWCADVDEKAAHAAAARFGAAHAGADYEALLARYPVDAVSICTPHHLHHPAALAAIRHGAHVCCEKPLARSPAEAAEMTAAAEARGVRTMVAFSYHFSPAARLMKELIDAGDLGEILQIEASYAKNTSLTAAPMSWRYQRALAGSGALGDLGAHLIHLLLWWAGDLKRVAAYARTFVPERALPRGGMAPVDVEDAVAVTGELACGALCQLTASLVCHGHKNALRIVVHGRRGSALYEYTTLRPGHELRVSLGRPRAESRAWAGLTPVGRAVTRLAHAAGRPLWVTLPARARHRVSQMAHFIDAVSHDHPAEPDFRAGLRVQQVMAAVEEAAATGAWVEVESLTAAV
jgi:predicted dehydrogenase